MFILSLFSFDKLLVVFRHFIGLVVTFWSWFTHFVAYFFNYGKHLRAYTLMVRYFWNFLGWTHNFIISLRARCCFLRLSIASIVGQLPDRQVGYFVHDLPCYNWFTLNNIFDFWNRGVISKFGLVAILMWIGTLVMNDG